MAYRPVKLGPVVVALFAEFYEVLASFRHIIAVELQVEIADVRHDASVAFFLHPIHKRPNVLGFFKSVVGKKCLSYLA